uniref:Eukaryotic translation initiation factor 3 subunit L n=1 Tax=Elphidium margaritaceum TaxID=933848 RepID=A0A7S0XN38_9EUKA|mmetsp:Transcript_33/g.51  ORF Transcript_33/g.51 Transcript_33/m.51 type:complete len:569 (+) Transcript_33:28-1734(+)|eukprot:CAMPEP_0202695444 /NCGR_PEP_ID=MMETSP1385-20130828/9030_1 /ASSEMBLY_ACC=CAM_ASM_000861 /TAXON_ID=933848 /ORGANISM="Elphidium margaritaceum" /LENGTH=568 /DNA_ID=CAMNT_0049351467 /DNA_START=28 /DNA_END=1734 /DNA_ORIENTATION=-
MSRQQYGLSSSGVITDEVRQFLLKFKENVLRGNARALYVSYTTFQQITEKTYQVSTWPLDVDVIRNLKLNQRDESTKIFLYLYRELYYRHAFERCDITEATMHESFQNYANLFNTVLDYYDEDKAFPEIPNVWLWAFIHSFVSQFQYYHHWRADPTDGHKNLSELVERCKSDAQRTQIAQKWNVQLVLRYLHCLVSAAQIPIKYNEPPDVDIIAAQQQQQQGATPTKKMPSITMQMLGFFALIGLCRIHCMLGDYRTAIDVMDRIDLKARGSAITKLASCGITAHYYLAFAYCMTRRFPDAHHMLCTLLRNPRYEKGDIRRRFEFVELDDDKKGKSGKEAALDQELSGKDRYHRAYLSNEAMLDRAWAMLAIAHTQAPSKLDEATLGGPLREYFNTEIEDLNDNSSSADRRRASYQKLFQTAAPDFINTFDAFSAQDKQLTRVSAADLNANQFRAFMRLTSKRMDMLKIKNEIRLFRVIPLHQFAKAMSYEDSEIGKLNRELIRLKWRMTQNKKVDSWGNTKDQFTFYIRNDCVYVQELQTSQLWKYSDYFVRNIQTVTDWIETDNLM